MPKSCLAEVEAFPDNDSLGKGRRTAFVRIFVPDSIDVDLKEFVGSACEFMGFAMKELSEIESITEDQIPMEAKEAYQSRGAGFGTFHTFAPE